MEGQENEIELMLECAAKVKKHLTRALEEKKEIALKLKLNYVDEIILEAAAIKRDVVIYS